MKIFWLILIALIHACKFNSEAPTLSQIELDKQEKILINSIESLIYEPDLRAMHQKARALEESRVIECKAIGEECNIHHEILNKIVKLTSDQEFSAADKKEIEEALLDLKKEIRKNRPVKKP